MAVSGHIVMVNAQQKGKFVQNAENQIILPQFVSLLILMLLLMKMIILSNTLIVVIFPAVRQVCKIPKFNYKSSYQILRYIMLRSSFLLIRGVVLTFYVMKP